MAFATLLLQPAEPGLLLVLALVFPFELSQGAGASIRRVSLFLHHRGQPSRLPGCDNWMSGHQELVTTTSKIYTHMDGYGIWNSFFVLVQQEYLLHLFGMSI